MKPDYHQIFEDIINLKYPDKKDICEKLLKKKILSFQDILKINQIIFGEGDIENQRANQRHRFYKTEDIVVILNFQKINCLNNSETAKHFNLSRNSVAKWKRIFSSQIH